MNQKLLNEFTDNLKLAGGEILNEIPEGWHTAKAEFGIAENGAVWIEDYNKELFLSENVAVILNKNQIFKLMTDVMDKIENPGVFISGPSKTADVESFLVFGAHGAVKLGIFFTE